MGQYGNYKVSMTDQGYLNTIFDYDGQWFLDGEINNWCNHRGLLLLGLHLTQGSVLELGSGEGSSPYLRKYCEESNRHFLSFDNNEEWCEKTGAEYAYSWNAVVGGAAGTHSGLIFIDHAPGERRHL